MMKKYGIFYCDYARDDEAIFEGTLEECESYFEENALYRLAEDSYGEESYEICEL